MPFRPKVLVADDDPKLCQAIKTRLQQHNIDVLVANDGYSSLVTAMTESPDVMVLDINMPAGDGFSVQERLEKSEGGANIPVIYLTGDRSDRLDKLAMKLGAVAVHHKPFLFKDLLKDVQRCLMGMAA